MNNGWHEIEAMLPPLGMLVWVLEEDGNIVLAKRFDTGTGMWVWSTIGVNLFKGVNGEIKEPLFLWPGGRDLHLNFIKLNAKYWHELPQLPRVNNTLTLSKQVDSVGNYEQTGYTPGKIEPPTDRGWWCPACEEPLEWKDVTFEEFHDVRRGGCGGKVIIKKHEQ